jgi:hypothetical protein
VRAVLLLALLALATIPAAACTRVDAAPASTAPDAASAGAGPSALLDRLAVGPEQDAATYRRAAFGRRWADVDGNGCSTRDDVLARDLEQVRRRGRCVVVAGTFTDVYTGATGRFEKARADLVQIDHVVALAEAWRSGASTWTEDRRLRYANDPTVLVVTTRAVNSGKGDQDAGTWAPADRSRACRFARMVVEIKTAYGLSVDPRERAGLRSDLAGCP